MGRLSESLHFNYPPQFSVDSISSNPSTRRNGRLARRGSAPSVPIPNFSPPSLARRSTAPTLTSRYLSYRNATLTEWEASAAQTSQAQSNYATPSVHVKLPHPVEIPSEKQVMRIALLGLLLEIIILLLYLTDPTVAEKNNGFWHIVYPSLLSCVGWTMFAASAATPTLRRIGSVGIVVWMTVLTAMMAIEAFSVSRDKYELVTNTTFMSLLIWRSVVAVGICEYLKIDFVFSVLSFFIVLIASIVGLSQVAQRLHASIILFYLVVITDMLLSRWRTERKRKEVVLNRKRIEELETESASDTTVANSALEVSLQNLKKAVTLLDTMKKKPKLTSRQSIEVIRQLVDM